MEKKSDNGLSLLFSMVVLIVIMLLITSEAVKTTTLKSIEVNAIVTDMHYEEPYITTASILVGTISTVGKVSHPEKYHVTLTYNNITKTFDNKDLYNSVKIGDYVTVVYKEEVSYASGTTSTIDLLLDSD